MPSRTLVVNASPLITLFRANLSGILPALYPTILVPTPVWYEIVSGGHEDAATTGLLQSDWASRLPEYPPVPNIQAWDLGVGETSVISYVYEHPEYKAVLDDGLARHCARTFGILFMGTGGLIVTAKRKGIIPSAKEALSALKNAGLWIASDVDRRHTFDGSR